MESSSFIQKLKTFNISNARQLVSMYCSHVESLGNFKNKYKTKKEKVRNQTTYITKFSKKKEREMNKEEEEKKERRRRRSSCFMASPLLHCRLLPFLLLLCFLSLQMRLFVFRPDIHLPAEKARFRRYSRYAAGIFFGTKKEGYLYRCTSRYIPYRPIWYRIDFLGYYC